MNQTNENCSAESDCSFLIIDELKGQIVSFNVRFCVFTRRFAYYLLKSSFPKRFNEKQFCKQDSDTNLFTSEKLLTNQ